MAFGDFVQSSNWSSFTSVTSKASTLAGITAGNILVMVVDYGPAGVGTWSVSDTINTWVIAENNAATAYLLIAYALNVASGSATVTASTTGSASNVAVQLLEYSATSSAIFDTANKVNGSTASLPLTTAQANELVVAAIADGGSTSIAAPLTARGSGNSFINIGDHVFVSSGAQTLTGTYGSGSGAMVGMAFAANPLSFSPDDDAWLIPLSLPDSSIISIF